MPAPRGRKPDLTRHRHRAPGDNPLPIPPGTVLESLDDPSDGLPESAADVWREVVPGLARSGILVPGDRWLLEQFCIAAAIADRLGAELVARVEAGEGASPEVKRLRTSWRDAVATADRLGAQLGLNPVARARLGVVHASTTSLLAHLDSSLGT